MLAGAVVASSGITTSVYAQDVLGRLTASYRGHYGTPHDRNSASWRGWEDPQSPSRISVALWPDVTELDPQYLAVPSAKLVLKYSPSGLFSSAQEDTADVHLRWLKQYGIDGVMMMRTVGQHTKPKETHLALASSSLSAKPAFTQCDSQSPHQLRFRPSKGEPINHRSQLSHHQNHVLSHISQAAEKRGVTVFVMYELSPDQLHRNSWLPQLKKDLHNHLKPHVSGPSWALENYRPVIGIKGIGLHDPGRSPSDYLELIRFLHSEGFYVIGGVNPKWQTQSRLSRVFRRLDMIMPWTVGQYKTLSALDTRAKQQYESDIRWTASRNVDYLPVIWPGRSPVMPNSKTISRRRGQFLWRQFHHLYRLGYDTALVATLDGYDDGTAILKAAADSLMIPQKQQARTVSNEGGYLSSDFYLRLAGEGARLIRRQRGESSNVPILASDGPIWFRSSFEQDLDAATTWNNSPIRKAHVSNARCEQVFDGESHLGSGSIAISGLDESTSSSYAYFKSINVMIPVNYRTQLSFWLKAGNKLGRHVTIDLVTTDGSTLSTSNAQLAKGSIGKWRRVHAHIGTWLRNKVVRQIVIGYDCTPCKGRFAAWIDDIEITDAPIATETSVASQPVCRIDTGNQQTAASSADDADTSGYDAPRDSDYHKYVVEPISLQEYAKTIEN